MEKVTIKDIARICNVGVSTVSRAINDDPGINQVTKARIKDVIKQYNYTPNSSARFLKMTQTNTIALLVKGIDNQFFGAFIKYFEEELKELKYTFVLYAVRENEDEIEVAKQLVQDRKLSGIIFLGGKIAREDEMAGLNVPFVLCTVAVDTQLPPTNAPSVSVNDEEAGYLMVDYLCNLGHKKIAILAAKEDDHSVGYLRLLGYKRALIDHGIPYDENLVCHMEHDLDEFSIENGYVVTKKLCESDVEFTALFSISDIMALGAYRALLERGIQIPSDVSVAGFDGILLSNYYYPSLTTVVQPVGEMVHASISLLQDAINGVASNRTISITPKLKLGESTSKH